MECTSKKKTPKSAYLALLALTGTILLAICLVAGILKYYLPGFLEVAKTGNKDAIADYFASQGHFRSYLMMWFLSYIQVVCIVLPAPAVHAAAGAVCGSLGGTLIVYTASIAAHMSVFFIACKATELLRYLSEERPHFGRLLNSLQFSEHRTYYIAMALLTPGLPNWIIPYAAANSRMKPYTYLIALVIALPLPIYLTCFAANCLTQGNYLFSILSIGALYLFVGLLFIGRRRIPDLLMDLWYYLKYEVF